MNVYQWQLKNGITRTKEFEKKGLAQFHGHRLAGQAVVPFQKGHQQTASHQQRGRDTEYNTGMQIQTQPFIAPVHESTTRPGQQLNDDAEAKSSQNQQSGSGAHHQGIVSQFNQRLRIEAEPGVAEGTD